MPLERIQQALSELYDLELESSVEDFVCDEGTVQATVGAEAGRGEVLLVAEDADGISVGLYVQPSALDSLAMVDEESWFEEDRFEAACLATEGVSHFVYLMFRAERSTSVSQLELELQAEVDKYATGLLAGNGVGAIRARSRSIRRRLFHDVEYIDGAHTEAGQRYRTASRVASRYVQRLEERHLGRGDLGDLEGLRAELRRFYRLGLREKLEAGD